MNWIIGINGIDRSGRPIEGYVDVVSLLICLVPLLLAVLLIGLWWLVRRRKRKPDSN